MSFDPFLIHTSERGAVGNVFHAKAGDLAQTDKHPRGHFRFGHLPRNFLCCLLETADMFDAGGFECGILDRNAAIHVVPFGGAEKPAGEASLEELVFGVEIRGRLTVAIGVCRHSVGK